MSENRVIGLNNQLPWHIPADLKYFKNLTTGHTVVMGRKTFESNGRPLPNRSNVVITRKTDYNPPDVTIVHTLDEALGTVENQTEIFIIGGEEIFRLALPFAVRLYLTIIHTELKGDTYFPEIDCDAWKLASDERHESDENNHYAYSFRVYERARQEQA